IRSAFPLNQGRAFYANLLICQAFFVRLFSAALLEDRPETLLLLRVREAHSTGLKPLVNAFLETLFTVAVEASACHPAGEEAHYRELESCVKHLVTLLQ